MLRLRAAATMLARRRSPAHLRQRHLQSRPSSITEDMIANLSEAERAEVSKILAEKDADLDSRLLQQVDAYFQITTFSNDQGFLSRMLTFCGVPKGDRRDKLMWRSTVVATFLGSMVMGHLQARKCNQRHYEHHHEEKSAAAVSHSG